MLDYRAFRTVHTEIKGAGVGGQENRDRIIAELGQLGHAGAQGASSGSFAFTESDIRKVITNWLDIKTSYDESLDKANYLTFGEGPGLDFASKSFAVKGHQSHEALIQHLLNGREYSTNQAQLALNALNDYLGVEHMSVAEFLKAQQQGPGTEV